MKKIRVFIGIMVTVIMLIGECSIRKVWAADTYTMTYRTGAVGEFDTQRTQEMLTQAGFSADRMQVTQNYVKIIIERGEAIPSFSQTEWEACVKISQTEKYFVLPEEKWNTKAGSGIEKNEESVVDYGVLVNPVKYKINFVDTESNTPVAAPVIGYGNEGDKIPCTPIQVQGYVTAAQPATIKLQKDMPNEVTFSYDSTAEPVTEKNTVEKEQVVTTTIPGETTVIPANRTAVDDGNNTTNIQDNNVPLADTVDNENPNDTNQENAQNQDDPEVENGEDTTTIEDNEVPLEDNAEKTTTIKDETVPKAAKPEQKKVSKLPIIVGTGVGVLALAGGTTAFIRKKKKIKNNA